MKRIGYLDTSKAIGMYLVYYGHFIEKLYYAGASSIFLELKLIYSFHVPLFFFLAGIFWKPDNSPLPLIFAHKFKTRIMPTLFFGLIAIPWFLVCLFSLEMLLAVFTQTLGFPSKPKAVVYAAVFFVICWLLSDNADAITWITGIIIIFQFAEIVCVTSVNLSEFCLVTALSEI